MPVIGIDARKYFDFGIGTYLQNLVQHLSQRSLSYTFLLLVDPADRNHVTVPPGWGCVSISEKKYSLSELFILGLRAQRLGVRLFHIPHYTLPYGLRIPSLVTVHDLIHLRFPQYFSRMQRLYANTVMRHAVTSASGVITDSQFAKQDLLSHFRMDDKRVHAIPLGVSGKFTPASDRNSLDAFRAAHGLRNPFVLYVGGNSPHKNIITLLRAFARVAEKRSDMSLVFVGKAPGGHPDLAGFIERNRLDKKILYLGKLSDADLANVYRSAEMLVLPSLYEGFGFPPLEAMACGTPSVVSDRGALPEVVGDAALVCPAEDENAFADAMMTIIDRPVERQELIRRGLANIKRFSWDETARKTLEVYEAFI